MNLATLNYHGYGTEAMDGSHLHSGPTPRGKLADAARLPWARALKSANASVLRMIMA